MTDEVLKTLVGQLVATVPPAFKLLKSEEVPVEDGQKILIHAFTDGTYRVTTSLNALKSPLRRIERAFFVKGVVVKSQRVGAAYHLRGTVWRST